MKPRLPATWLWPGDVEGWLDKSEGEKLAELACGKTVLEIGSWHGRSTIAMAQTAKKVHAIDWCRGDWGTGSAWTLPKLAENIKRYGLLDVVVLHVGRTVDVGTVLENDSFDVAFIDGAHDEESAAEDMRLAARVVKSGGNIALHDWGSPEVKAAARQVLGWKDKEEKGDREEVEVNGETTISLHYRRIQ